MKAIAKRFIVAIAVVFFGCFGSAAMADSKNDVSGEIIPGMLEFSWGVSWDCEKKPCVALKSPDMMFYPLVVPKGVTQLSPGRGISIWIKSFSMSEFLKITSSLKGIPDAFMKHKERYFVVYAKLKFPNRIDSSKECDTWHYATQKAVIVEIGKEAFVSNYSPGGCGSRPYDEVMKVIPKTPGKTIAIRTEMDVNSAEVIKIDPDRDFVLKLETMGDGSTWIKVNRLLRKGGESDYTGYLYLPDVELEPTSY